MAKKQYEIEKLIHERVRLLIITHLASSDTEDVSFNTLQKELQLTSGNLSVQLKKLSDADYVAIHKQFRDNKPLTTIRITGAGRNALDRYILEMEQILQQLKS
ncbi:MAG: transcriptional regulator [Desulfobacteraceae bacterium]|nr:MAG: transcriptional regulator [Desulfobacteraceae bacterium]